MKKLTIELADSHFALLMTFKDFTETEDSLEEMICVLAASHARKLVNLAIDGSKLMSPFIDTDNVIIESLPH